MNELNVRCAKSGNVYTMVELSTMQATDAFAMAAAQPITIHYSVALALRTMNGHPFAQFYGAKNEPPNAMAVRLPLEDIPEGDLNKLFRRYNEGFGLSDVERKVQIERLDGRIMRVHSVRYGHDYEFRELNSVRSGDAISMAAGTGNPIHYRMAFALVRINGREVPYTTRNAVVREVIKHIPLSDMELINYHYNAEFTSEDDDDDLEKE